MLRARLLSGEFRDRVRRPMSADMTGFFYDRDRFQVVAYLHGKPIATLDGIYFYDNNALRYWMRAVTQHVIATTTPSEFIDFASQIPS